MLSTIINTAKAAYILHLEAENLKPVIRRSQGIRKKIDIKAVKDDKLVIAKFFKNSNFLLLVNNKKKNNLISRKTIMANINIFIFPLIESE
jgi:hypothetical protein